MTGQSNPRQSSRAPGRVCQGCGGELPPPKAPSPPRKWCSDRCRKIASYTKPCIDCGGPTGMSGTAQSNPRCTSCSHEWEKENARWTRQTIIAAIRQWADEHGGVAPSSTDWNTTLSDRGDGYPATNTVRKVFGLWSAATRAAGFEPKKTGRPPKVAA